MLSQHIKMKTRPTVFISYNQKSASKIADEIQDRISTIATVLRDATTIPDWGNIEDFMKSIQLQDMVVMIITDEYLRSSACMFEVTQAMQNEGWQEHVMFVVTDSASDIYSPRKWPGYLEYWEKEAEELKNLIESITDKAKAVKLIEEQKKIQQITLNMLDFLGSVKKSKNPGVDVAVERIYSRVRGTVTESAFTNNRSAGIMAANAGEAGDRSCEESAVIVVRDDYGDKITYAGGRPSVDRGNCDKEDKDGGVKMDTDMTDMPGNYNHMPILLLLDMSGSMYGREEILEEGIKRFVEDLRKTLAENRFDERGFPLAVFEVGVAVYNSDFEIVVPISSVDNKESFEDFEFHASGGTELFWGVRLAYKYLQSYCGEILSDGGCVYGATLVVLGEGIATDCIGILGESQGIDDRTYCSIRNGRKEELKFSNMFHYIPVVLKNYNEDMEAIVQLYEIFPDWYRWKEKSVYRVDIEDVNILFGWLSSLFVESGQCHLREDVLNRYTLWIEKFDSEQLFT